MASNMHLAQFKKHSPGRRLGGRGRARRAAGSLGARGGLRRPPQPLRKSEANTLGGGLKNKHSSGGARAARTLQAIFWQKRFRGTSFLSLSTQRLKRRRRFCGTVTTGRGARVSGVDPAGPPPSGPRPLTPASAPRQALRGGEQLCQGSGS